VSEKIERKEWGWEEIKEGNKEKKGNIQNKTRSHP
jgi:hypothetical protein